MVKSVTNKSFKSSDSIGALKVLNYLDLSQAKVSLLYELICALTMLETLDLLQKISILPNSIGDLINIAWLSLSQTRKSSLPYSIGALKVLKLLDLLQTNVSVLLESRI